MEHDFFGMGPTISNIIDIVIILSFFTFIYFGLIIIVMLFKKISRLGFSGAFADSFSGNDTLLIKRFAIAVALGIFNRLLGFVIHGH